MPETYTTDVPATQVRAGDVDPITGVRVEHVRVGTKWVTITNEPGTGPAWRVPLTEVVTVQRQRPTADEAAAERRVHALRVLDMREESARDAVTRLRKQVAERALAGRLSWSDIEALPVAEVIGQLYAQTARQHMRAVLEACDFVGGRWLVAGDGRPSDLYLADVVPNRLDVVADIAREVKDRFWQFGGYMYGSTSNGSRLLADADRQGRADWLRDVGWAAEAV